MVHLVASADLLGSRPESLWADPATGRSATTGRCPWLLALRRSGPRTLPVVWSTLLWDGSLLARDCFESGRATTVPCGGDGP